MTSCSQTSSLSTLPAENLIMHHVCTSDDLMCYSHMIPSAQSPSSGHGARHLHVLLSVNLPFSAQLCALRSYGPLNWLPGLPSCVGAQRWGLKEGGVEVGVFTAPGFPPEVTATWLCPSTKRKVMAPVRRPSLPSFVFRFPNESLPFRPEGGRHAYPLHLDYGAALSLIAHNALPTLL